MNKINNLTDSQLWAELNKNQLIVNQDLTREQRLLTLKLIIQIKQELDKRNLLR